MNGSLFDPQGIAGIATGSTLQRAMNAPVNGLEVLLAALRGYVLMEPCRITLTNNGLSLLMNPGNYDPAAIDILRGLFPITTTNDRTTVVEFDKHGQPNCNTGRFNNVAGTKRSRAWQVAQGYRVHTRGWHPLRLFTLLWLFAALSMFLGFVSTPTSYTTDRIGLGSLSLFFVIAAIINATARIYKITWYGRMARIELKSIHAHGKQILTSRNQHLLPWLWLVRPRQAVLCLKDVQAGDWWQGTQAELANELPRLIRAIHCATTYSGQPF